MSTKICCCIENYKRSKTDFKIWLLVKFNNNVKLLFKNATNGIFISQTIVCIIYKNKWLKFSVKTFKGSTILDSLALFFIVRYSYQDSMLKARTLSLRDWCTLLKMCWLMSQLLSLCSLLLVLVHRTGEDLVQNRYLKEFPCFTSWWLIITGLNWGFGGMFLLPPSLWF